MSPPPSKSTDHEELVPLTRDNNNLNTDENGENDSEDDIIRDTHQSSETTLAARDSDSESGAYVPGPVKHGNLDKADRLRDLRNGESIAEEGERLIPDATGKIAQKKREGPVGWMDLPHKGQLAVLTIARLAEPLVQTSLQVSF